MEGGRNAAAAFGLACFVALLTAGPSQAGHPLGDAANSASFEERAGAGFGDPLARRSGFANRCRVIIAGGGRGVTTSGDGYAIERGGATPLHFKPTRIRSYLIQDLDGQLIEAGEDGAVGRSMQPGRSTEWRIVRRPNKRWVLRSTATRQFLAVDSASGVIVAVDRDSTLSQFTIRVTRDRCQPYPEARVNAKGRPRDATRNDGSIFGFADAHLHVSANLRAGGQVISGEPFNRFGITEALGRDAEVHGPNGELDVTGNLLRDGSPVGTHETDGWPTFVGWPVNDTITHQQAYYMWLKRAWKSGMRLIVAQAVEDQALCELEPLRNHSCDETETVKLAVAQLRKLERYVDAQSGGVGRGWFKIVTTPAEARSVASQGKLAVVLGMETSSPLGCSEFLGSPQCTRGEAIRVLDELEAIGIRTMFIAHWPDNGYSGAALQGGAQGQFIETFQLRTTGQPFSTEPCGDADEAGGTCNSKGLTGLGAFLFDAMRSRGIMIEADHLSQHARATTFGLADEGGFPLVSSHTGTGGEWTEEQLARLAELGGITAATPSQAPQLIEKIRRLRKSADPERGRGVALGSDTGGFAGFPGPRDEGEPLAYPFESVDGRVTFKRQRTGERVFDLNEDGVAHYGLFPDLIADMQLQPGGKRAIRSLFNSAEAYIQMWEQAERAR